MAVHEHPRAFLVLKGLISFREKYYEKWAENLDDEILKFDKLYERNTDDGFISFNCPASEAIKLCLA